MNQPLKPTLTPFRSFWTAANLKRIALTTMIIDHVAASLLLTMIYYQDSRLAPGMDWIMVYTIMRSIGRLAFPIYLFLLVEGYHHTHNLKRYLMRLGALAFVSEIPFDLAFNHTWWDLSHQNIFFELFLALILFILLDRWQEHFLLQVLAIAMLAVLAEWACLDYGWYGILAAGILYLCHPNRLYMALGVLVGFLFELSMPTVFLAAPMVYWYNGQRGRVNQAFHYWIYPIHLALLAIAYYLLYP